MRQESHTKEAIAEKVTLVPIFGSTSASKWHLMVKAPTQSRNTRERIPSKGASINDIHKFSDFLTPSPLSAFGSDLYYKSQATSYTTSAFP